MPEEAFVKTTDELDEDANRSARNLIHEWCEAREIDQDELGHMAVHFEREFVACLEEGLSPRQAINTISILAMQIGYEAAMRHGMPNPLE